MMTAYFYAFGAILCWASLPAATGSGLSGLSTAELMFYSFSAAAISLYAKDVLTTKSFWVRFPDLKGCLWGVWGIFIYHYVYYLALERAPLAEGAILATTWSLWIVVFSSILQFKRITPAMFGAGLLGLVGAGLVIASGKELVFSSSYTAGYLLALCCGLIWSSFSVWLPRMDVGKEPMTSFTIIAVICSFLLYLFSGPHTIPDIPSVLSACYLGFVPLGLSFFLWNRALKRGNMVVIGFLSYLTPLLSVLLVAVIHQQKIDIQVIFGMLIIIGASLLGRIILNRQEQRIRR